MRQEGLKGVCRRRWPKTTVRSSDHPVTGDLVQRNFQVEAPNRLWVADITYLPILGAFLYLAVVMDAFSRRIVGWSMKPHLKTELVTDALLMAIQQRQPPVGVIHHSDQGCQYTSIEFGKHCRLAGIRPSQGSVGDCYDNALCESFFATLECELIDRSRWDHGRQAQLAVFDFIEGWYNPHRLHSALGYTSPAAFEQSYYDGQSATN
jgi:transposase InsO family protein